MSKPEQQEPQMYDGPEVIQAILGAYYDQVKQKDDSEEEEDYTDAESSAEESASESLAGEASTSGPRPPCTFVERVIDEHIRKQIKAGGEEEGQMYKRITIPKKKCGRCKKNFDDEAKFQVHHPCWEKRALKKRPAKLWKDKNGKWTKFECFKCGRFFSKLGALKLHTAIRLPDYICLHCHKFFAKKASVLNHLEKDHKK